MISHMNVSSMETALLTPVQVMLIGLMSLRNHTLFVQFHPVAYMVKLNIEMSVRTSAKLLRGLY